MHIRFLIRFSLAATRTTMNFTASIEVKVAPRWNNNNILEWAIGVPMPYSNMKLCIEILIVAFGISMYIKFYIQKFNG